MHPVSNSWLLVSPEVLRAAEVLWNYHILNQPPSRAEGIIVFGSNDLRVAEHAISLYEKGFGQWILFSGARGRMTADWPETEAATMAALALSAGVPKELIFIEDRATHTGENINFSRKMLVSAGILPSRVVVVQKPYMERRTKAALDVHWPEIECFVTSPPISFASYFNVDLPLELVIEAMVGDFQRILAYPQLGFASEQLVPDAVLEAYQFLCRQGFEGQMRIVADN